MSKSITARCCYCYCHCFFPRCLISCGLDHTLCGVCGSTNKIAMKTTIMKTIEFTRERRMNEASLSFHHSFVCFAAILMNIRLQLVYIYALKLFTAWMTSCFVIGSMPNVLRQNNHCHSSLCYENVRDTLDIGTRKWRGRRLEHTTETFRIPA